MTMKWILSDLHWQLKDSTSSSLVQTGPVQLEHTPKSTKWHHNLVQMMYIL